MAVSCARHVGGLRRRGIAVDVVAFTTVGEDEKSGGVRIRERDCGVDIHLDPLMHPGAALQLAWRHILLRNNQNQYDIVAGFGANLPGYAATTWAARLGAASAVLVRGNDFDRDWFDNRRGFMVNEAFARANAIGAVTLEKVAWIKSLYPDAIVQWTQNGIDVPAWELLPADREIRDTLRAELSAEGRRVVGIFGELKYKKRIPLWLGALRDAALVERVGVLVVGRLDEETAQILADPSLAPLNKIIPFAPPDQLPGYYAACDFFAIPSLFEGMPNTLLEAMACGVVPITSDAGAMGDVVEDGLTGFVFPAEDRPAAAQATLRALSLTDSQLAEMSSRVKTRACENFSTVRELDTLLGLFAAAKKNRKNRGHLPLFAQ